MTPVAATPPEGDAGRRPVILDVDTGIDDALAILFALRSPEFDVLGITCVNGNVSVDQVVANTCFVLEASGDQTTPVARGADRPLAEPPRHSTAVHGVDGLGGLNRGTTGRRAIDEDAVAWLRETLLNASQPVTLIGLGPQTNLATLLKAHPQVRRQIDRIFLMAGTAAAPGNASAVAEFNVRCDPEAADTVLRSELPITLYTLDVFRGVSISRADTEPMKASLDAGARLCGELLESFMRTFARETTSIGDAGLVAAIAQPATLTTERLAVDVELRGELTRGQTVIDRRLPAVRQLNAYWGGAREPNADVTTAVDGAKLSAHFRNVMTPPQTHPAPLALANAARRLLMVLP